VFVLILHLSPIVMHAFVSPPPARLSETVACFHSHSSNPPLSPLVLVNTHIVMSSCEQLCWRAGRKDVAKYHGLKKRKSFCHPFR